jgi:hypothetical protein
LSHGIVCDTKGAFVLQVTGNIYYLVPQLFPKQKQAVYTTLRSLFKALHSKGAFFTLFLNTVGGCDCCALLKAKGFRGSYIVTYCILLTAWNLNLRMSFQRWMILYKHVDMVVFILSARVGLVKTAAAVNLHHVKLVF